MIPKKERPEWADLIKGKINPELSSFSLKMKISALRQNYKHGDMSVDDAIDDLYELCSKYEKIYADDFTIIFESKTVTL